MSEEIKLTETTPQTVLEFQFPEKPQIVACSANVCQNGHEWQPEVALAGCPGCSGPLLVVKMVQCPICNEPVAKFRLRTDHLPKGGVITPICKGSASQAEVGVLEIPRQHYVKEEQNHVVREMPAKV